MNIYDHTWDTCPNMNISLADIDTARVMWALRETVEHHRLNRDALSITDPMDVLLGYHLLYDDKKVMVNAANVLFGKDPCKLHVQCKLKMLRLKGNTKLEIFDQTLSEGNLFEQYDTAVKFCVKHLQTKSDESVLAVPIDVIKEAITNMLAHRSWVAESIIPSIAIYDNGIEFQNPGIFPNGITWEDYVKNGHGSVLRNKLIAGVFYRCGLMWDFGSGIKQMFESCKNAGISEPIYNTDFHSVTLTINLKKLTD